MTDPLHNGAGTVPRTASEPDSDVSEATDGLPPVELPGGVLAVPGFHGAAGRCGLYDEDRDDLALIVSDRVCTAAGVFTRNEFPAAPVVLSKRKLQQRPEARSIVINAGNANALTGPEGTQSAGRMLSRLEERCGGPGLVLSTGVIGVPLPIDPVLAGIDEASKRVLPSLDHGAADRPKDDPIADTAGSASVASGSTDRVGIRPAADDAVARAILTTDTRPKTSAVQVRLPGESRLVTIGGVAKGSGMIHPNMATMLAVVAMDRAVEPQLLSRMLREAVDVSFHRISVDGDTSTNDAVLLLSRPSGGELPVDEGSRSSRVLRAGLQVVCRRLAEQIVADGEGMTKVLQVDVEGARSELDARQIASTIAGSALVKTAVAGRDPNWGRFIAVAGNAGVPLDPSTLELDLGGVVVYREGRPREILEEEAGRIFEDDVVVARLNLHQGPYRARMTTTDLTSEYVRINSEYTT